MLGDLMLLLLSVMVDDPSAFYFSNSSVPERSWAAAAPDYLRSKLLVFIQFKTMSAYAHQMEREYSAQSLLSGGDSELRSGYVIEAGFYMTSFVGTIFLASLVTVGVLFVTLLVALAVMLQSCENRAAGVVDMPRQHDDFHYCNVFALQAELNNLGRVDFPSICRNLPIQLMKDLQYKRDLNITMRLVEKYFDRFVPLDDGLDVVLMDIDDILPPSPHHSHPLTDSFYEYGCSRCSDDVKYLKQMIFLKLYTKLQASGWALILLSRKPKEQQNATIEHLLSVGYSGWSSVIMRLDNETKIDNYEYFSRRREALQREGFRIAGVISSQMDALTGPFSGKRIFKFPNPIYYYAAEYDRESLHLPE